MPRQELNPLYRGRMWGVFSRLGCINRGGCDGELSSAGCRGTAAPRVISQEMTHRACSTKQFSGSGNGMSQSHSIYRGTI